MQKVMWLSFVEIIIYSKYITYTNFILINTLPIQHENVVENVNYTFLNHSTKSHQSLLKILFSHLLAMLHKNFL